jgi:hypothetical protein
MPLNCNNQKPVPVAKTDADRSSPRHKSFGCLMNRYNRHGLTVDCEANRNFSRRLQFLGCQTAQAAVRCAPYVNRPATRATISPGGAGF